MADLLPSDHTSLLGRDIPCPSCGHSPMHLLRCGCEIEDGVVCPCRGVAVPGSYPAAS